MSTRLVVPALAVGLLLAPAPLAQADDVDRVWATFTADGAWDRVDKDATGAPPPPSDSGDGWSGGPFNESCFNATIIPGGVVNYAPSLLNTVGAGPDACEVSASCASGGSTNSVWYSYTPEQDGFVEIDTFGTNYDTVLTVFDGCSQFIGGLFCVYPEELACSDDYFFGTTSFVTLSVSAGETYRIRVADDTTALGGGLLDFHLRYAPSNQLCSSATDILGETHAPPLLSTHNADPEPCEAEESCEFNGVGVSNSVWYRYVPPCDGFVSINTNGSDYDTVLSVFDGCGVFNGVDNPCGVPMELACDDDAGVGTASQLLDVPVSGGQELFIKVSDYNTTQGGGWLDFHFAFSAASPPLADIASPADFGCLCGVDPVSGTADVGGAGGLSGWVLDYTSSASDTWTELMSSDVPVVAGQLAAWDTTGLAQGHYLLRLTVTNACGATASDTEVVFVDRQLDVAEIHGPLTGALIGGTACIEGSARDVCFAGYSVDVAPSGSGSFTPVGGSPFSSQVTTNPLVPGGWDTSSLADGLYDLRLRVTDQCGTVGEVVERVEIDNTEPVAEISSPRPCLVSAGVVSFRGTASDANLSHWQLQITGGAFDGWSILAQGEESVVDGLLGSVDLGALPKCAYTVRLLVWDGTDVDCGHTRFSEALVSISNQAAVIGEPHPVGL